MTTDAEDLIKELRLNEETNDPALSDARDFALRCLRSKAPIPQTVMTVVERGAFHPASDYADGMDNTSNMITE